MRTTLAMLAIAALFVVPGSAAATTPDIQQRDELIADQENLLNAYRCLFNVDVGVVPGGCPTPDVVVPGPAPASPTQKDIDVRDALIQDQTALLNVYRCRFGVDTEVVPGGCVDGAPAPDSGPARTQVIGCSPTLPDNALVIVDSPSPGAVLKTGFEATGCSRTFESNVQWRLVGRSGEELASGHTSGGGVDGPAPFQFTVDFDEAERQLAHLEVFEQDVSEGEGYPPPRVVVPVIIGTGGPVSGCDATLPDNALVIVNSPTAGAEFEREIDIAGCSRTFESNVQWRLVGRSGEELASGHTSGGGVDGPAPFQFTVDLPEVNRQVALLEVFEEDVSDGEGYPPPRAVLPVIIGPTA